MDRAQAFQFRGTKRWADSMPGHFSLGVGGGPLIRSQQFRCPYHAHQHPKEPEWGRSWQESADVHAGLGAFRNEGLAAHP